MENFVVSARKYRPTLFDSVVGQSHITTTLKNAIKSNHLAQAFLFCGPRGVGKTTCARILAKTINCQELGADGEACGKCASCQSFQENTSLTIHELDAASNNSVEDIRNLIDQVRYPPQSGKYKIYIIDEVHMLSPSAFNAFLKTLEEPPSYAIFILATTEKHKILPTILSRCQIFDFNRIQWKDMASHLSSIAEKEGIAAEPAALELISIKADGGLRDALSMFDLNVTFSTDNALRHADVLENLHILDSDYYFQLTDYFVNQNHTDALVLLDEIMRKGFDGQQFIAGLSEHFRNLLFAKDPKTLALMELSEENRTKFHSQSAKTSASFLLSSMNLCSQCEIHYKAAKNARLHVELTLLKINYLPSVYQPASAQPAVEGGAGKKSESKPIAPAAVSAAVDVAVTTPAQKDAPVLEVETPITQKSVDSPDRKSVV
jgi:DNA polymerase-3 subunit gamma/tau